MKRRSTEPGLGTGGIVPDAPPSERDRAAHELLEEIARTSTSPPPSAAVRTRRTTALETPQPDRVAPADSPPPSPSAPAVDVHVTPPPQSHRPITRTETSAARGTLSSRPPITRVSDPPPPGSQPPRSQRVVTTPPATRGSTPAPTGSAPPQKASKQSFRSSRPAIRVDDVGAGASKMSAPRMTPRVVQGANLKNAKIDSKDAFVLLDVPGLVDVAGLPGDEVSRILERLEGLGLVKLA